MCIETKRYADIIPSYMGVHHRVARALDAIIIITHRTYTRLQSGESETSIHPGAHSWSHPKSKKIKIKIINKKRKTAVSIRSISIYTLRATLLRVWINKKYGQNVSHFFLLLLIFMAFSLDYYIVDRDITRDIMRVYLKWNVFKPNNSRIRMNGLFYAWIECEMQNAKFCCLSRRKTSANKR